MKTKIIGIIVIVSGILMLAGAVYIYFFSDSSISDLVNKALPGNDSAVTDDGVDDFKIISKDNTSEPKKTIITPDKRIIEISPIGDEDIEEDEGKVTKDDLIRMSGSFAERFGSYSNQSNFANILDLKIFMTARMKYWADTFIKEQNDRVADNDIYYGITTKSIAKEMQDFDEDIGLATILVQTRRREATGASSNYSNIYNQEILITLIKENGAWKVDSAHWIN